MPERACCRKREISFPFSDYSNEWPITSARPHFHERLKLAQKLPPQQQQGHGDSPAAVARSWMAARFHCSVCAELAARAPRLLLQSAHQPPRFGACGITVVLGCQTISQQQICR